MAKLLYLVHRLPYPPNKGDKVRSFNLLKHLARRHEIFLGTFIDDPADEAFLDEVGRFCVDMHVARLSPRIARIKSLAGLMSGEALSLPYYRNSGLRHWVRGVLESQPIDAIVVFSSVMADYVDDMERVPTLVDFVDMDSAKWSQYASTHRWPLSWIYRREGERLLAYERYVAARARRSFFVTDAELALFARAAPEVANKLDTVCNGVDAEFFSPANAGISPFEPGCIPLVFTGAMDYWPNIDAALWFANDIFPRVRARHLGARFYVVGRSPDPAVTALETLADSAIVVTGTVDDVRPFIAHAALVVAPLRIARGIQNKILEAMAMARAVVAATGCAGPIGAVSGQQLLTADDADEFVTRIDELLSGANNAERIGRAARQHVLSNYSWDAHLSRLDPYLEGSPP